MPRKKVSANNSKTPPVEIEIPVEVVDVPLDVTPEVRNQDHTHPPAPTERVFIMRRVTSPKDGSDYKRGGGFVVAEYEVPETVLQTPVWSRPPENFDGAVSALEMHLFRKHAG